MNKTARVSVTDLDRHKHDQNRFAVIPTADKLNDDCEFKGKNICFALLDNEKIYPVSIVVYCLQMPADTPLELSEYYYEN